PAQARLRTWVAGELIEEHKHPLRADGNEVFEGHIEAIAALEDPAYDLPQAARAILAVLVEELRSFDERVAVLDREIARHAKENAVARRLMTIRSKDDFKGRHFEATLILQAVSWYLRYPLSYRDIEELFLERSLEVDHATLNRWVLAYAPPIPAPRWQNSR